MIEKVLGKISSVKFGYGGYQDAMVGLTVGLETNSGSCVYFRGAWNIRVNSYTLCTESDRNADFIETMRFINQTLIDSKKDDISKLVSVPVEIEFVDGALHSWRVLTEVL